MDTLTNSVDSEVRHECNYKYSELDLDVHEPPLCSVLPCKPGALDLILCFSSLPDETLCCGPYHHMTIAF